MLLRNSDFSATDCEQNELNRPVHLFLSLLPCNLIPPHFLVRPNLTSKVAFLCFITCHIFPLSPPSVLPLQDFNCWSHALFSAFPFLLPSSLCVLSAILSLSCWSPLLSTVTHFQATKPSPAPSGAPLFKAIPSHHLYLFFIMCLSCVCFTCLNCYVQTSLQTDIQIWFMKWLIMRIFVHGCTLQQTFTIMKLCHVPTVSSWSK